jgi:hypothetical protein
MPMAPPYTNQSSEKQVTSVAGHVVGWGGGGAATYREVRVVVQALTQVDACGRVPVTGEQSEDVVLTAMVGLTRLRSHHTQHSTAVSKLSPALRAPGAGGGLYFADERQVWGESAVIGVAAEFVVRVRAFEAITQLTGAHEHLTFVVRAVLHLLLLSHHLTNHHTTNASHLLSHVPIHRRHARRIASHRIAHSAL